MRTAVLFKDCPIEGELTGIVGLRGQCVSTADSRNAKPSHIVYESKSAAATNFDDVLRICVSRGWTVAHIGEPNWG